MSDCCWMIAPSFPSSAHEFVQGLAFLLFMTGHNEFDDGFALKSYLLDEPYAGQASLSLSIPGLEIVMVYPFLDCHKSWVFPMCGPDDIMVAFTLCAL